MELLKMLNNLVEEEEFQQQFKNKLEFIFLLIQNSRYSSQNDEVIYQSVHIANNDRLFHSSIGCTIFRTSTLSWNWLDWDS